MRYLVICVLYFVFCKPLVAKKDSLGILIEKTRLKALKIEGRNFFEWTRLIDLNYDGKRDLIFGYTGPCGFANRICVLVCDSTGKDFVYDEILSSFNNATFLLSTKEVTIFSCFNGGGYGERRIFQNEKWNAIIRVEWDNMWEKQTATCIIKDVINNKKRIMKLKPFMIPPKWLLKSQVYSHATFIN